MKLSYDPRYNIAYVRFQEKQAGVETVRISDELVVDMAPDGTIYGIELLNANVQLWREDTGRLLVLSMKPQESVPNCRLQSLDDVPGEEARLPNALRSNHD